MISLWAKWIGEAGLVTCLILTKEPSPHSRSVSPSRSSIQLHPTHSFCTGLIVLPPILLFYRPSCTKLGLLDDPVRRALWMEKGLSFIASPDLPKFLFCAAYLDRIAPCSYAGPQIRCTTQLHFMTLCDVRIVPHCFNGCWNSDDIRHADCPALFGQNGLPFNRKQGRRVCPLCELHLDICGVPGALLEFLFLGQGTLISELYLGLWQCFLHRRHIRHTR